MNKVCSVSVENTACAGCLVFDMVMKIRYAVVPGEKLMVQLSKFEIFLPPTINWHGLKYNPYI